MRRVLLLSLPVVLFALTGCPSKPKPGECSSSKDCEAQEGYGKICIEGRCQECGQDTDCKAGFVCRDLKCVPRPECEKDADCPGGKTCQEGRCVAMAPKAECEKDADCGAGKACEAGKCVAAAAAADECGSLEALENIHFDFDKAGIRADATPVLEHHATCFKKLQPKEVVVAGNCDERGTAEYNLHLGERRAESAKKYLANLGVSSKALKTVSYGKERPLCTEHDESCWQKNRNAQFTVKR